MLASIFVTGGIDALTNPESKMPVAQDVAQAIADQVPALAGKDPETLIRINAATQVVAGTLLAFGRVPRLSSLALAVSLVPTTAGGHRFWEYDDPAQRKQQQAHFFKNVSLLGGLLIAVADTHGKPGLGWRARHAAEHAGAAVDRTRREARLAAKAARAKVPV